MNGNYKLSQLDSAALNALYDANRFNYAEADLPPVISSTFGLESGSSNGDGR